MTRDTSRHPQSPPSYDDANRTCQNRGAGFEYIRPRRDPWARRRAALLIVIAFLLAALLVRLGFMVQL